MQSKRIWIIIGLAAIIICGVFIINKPTEPVQTAEVVPTSEPIAEPTVEPTIEPIVEPTPIPEPTVEPTPMPEPTPVPESTDIEVAEETKGVSEKSIVEVEEATPEPTEAPKVEEPVVEEPKIEEPAPTVAPTSAPQAPAGGGGGMSEAEKQALWEKAQSLANPNGLPVVHGESVATGQTGHVWQ